MSLQEKYQNKIIPEMKKLFGYKSNMAVPRIEKVIINTGIGRFRDDQRAVEDVKHGLALISGQEPVFTLAKKAISAFKTRKGLKIGVKVTLRGKRMYDFLERLITAALPRSKDFRGLNSKGVDQRGNLTIGLKEHIIFPEITQEEVKTIFGLEICVTTNARNRQEGLALFKLFGFPIKEDK